MFAGMIFCCCDGFFPMHFWAKFNSFMLSDTKSSLGKHLIPAILMLALSFVNVAGRSFSLNVTPFSENIYPSVQCDWLQGILLQIYVLFHVVPFLIGYHLTLHHISMSWLLSLQVSFCCEAHFAIYNSESTSFLLVVEQCCTSFWNLWKPILWVDQRIMISTYLFSSLSGERNWEKTGDCRTKQSMHCKNVLPIWYWHRQHKWIWRLMKFQLQVLSVTQVCLSTVYLF